jgi:hypothetical protein
VWPLGPRGLAFLVLTCVLVASRAAPQAIRNLPGFREASVPRNDDGSSPEVPIGFEVNFFGQSHRTLFVNNNGNITFAGPLSTYVPFGLAGTRMPIIAAFFADVDTRPAGSEVVTYGHDTVDGHRAFGVDYFRVGYFSMGADRLNSFQIILIDRSDTGPGNFDIEFNYGQIAWDIGSASDGVAAVAGFSNGTGQHDALYELPGSMQSGAFFDNGAHSLIRGKLHSDVPGRYIFQARNGAVSILRIVTPPQLPEAAQGRPYSPPALAAEGGSPPYSWTAVDWPPDLGLRLDSSTGVISGSPARAGAFRLPVRVSDRAGTPPATQTFLLTVPETHRADLIPFLIEPREARVGEPVRVVAGLHTNPNGPPIRARDLPEPTTLELRVEDQVVVLKDDGQNGDEQAGNGRYSGTVVFHRAGPVAVILVAHNSTDHRADAVVQVAGSFLYRGGPVVVDLGTLRENSESCRPLVLAAEQTGEILFSLRLRRTLPPEHRLELRASGKVLPTDGSSLMIGPDARLEICLVTGKRAPSSEALGEPWLQLTAGGTQQQSIELRIRWRVNGLSFWQRWWWLFALILLALLLAFFVYGYIRPYRFARELALTFVPEYAELDETPQPLAQWRGVRIRFYQDARACLQPNYRVSGELRGALAVLTARSGGSAWVSPGRGWSLFRELDIGEWQEVAQQGQGARRGAVYRVGDLGPFFRLTTH